MARDIQDVIAQMFDAGMGPVIGTKLTVNGKHHRFLPDGQPASDRKKRGWYRLYSHTTRSGKEFITGSFGVWRGADNEMYLVKSADESFSMEERAEAKAAREAAARAAALDRKQEIASVSEKATKNWERAAQEGKSAYLDRKGVRAFGVRFAYGKLLVPLRDIEGRIAALQWISPEKNDQGTDKVFSTAADVVGKFHRIGEPVAGAPIVFVEGYATGASVHMAGGYCTVVCFNAGNIAPVVKAFRSIYPDGRFVIAGDDDRHLIRRLSKILGPYGIRIPLPDGRDYESQHPELGAVRARATWVAANGLYYIELELEIDGKVKTLKIENAGRRAADNAAKKFKALSVYPSFADENSSGTDFNDLHLAEGLDVVRQQLADAIDPAPEATAANAPSGAGAQKKKKRPWQGEGPLAVMMKRFTLIYGTSTVWDDVTRQLVRIEALKLAWRNLADVWLDHPDRRMINQDELVFDPTEKCPDHFVNMFDGFGLKPERRGKCDLLIEHVNNLCGEDVGLFEWVMKWLAYPLQHPGAKMRTALIMHGRREGTGKSFLFDVMRSIYGRYGKTVTQLQLATEFTDWMSQMLFCVAEEVVNQQERRHLKGLLQNMITNPILNINAKNLPLRTETNYANFVFLSNELMPLALNELDRRYTVIYTDTEQPDAYFKALTAEVANGGAAAFYHYLLNFDVGDFDEFTRPYNNVARSRMITLGMTAERRFYEMWKGGHLDVPYVSCRSVDLYQSFKAWCRLSGERFVPSQTQFMGVVWLQEKRERRRVRARMAPDGDAVPTQSICVYIAPTPEDIANCSDPTPDGAFEMAVLRFQDAMFELMAAARRTI